MRMHDVLHGTTRFSWTLRLITYIALVVTAAAILQFLNVFLID